MMRRKSILIASTVMTSVCLLGACGKIKSESQVWQEELSVSDKKEENQMETAVTDLTGQTAQGVTIDYSTDSYESVQKFGYDLLAQSIQDENPMLSPVSAYLALSMAGCGADGTTKEEFYNVLGNDMMALSDDMMNILPAKGDLLNLSIADSAWIDEAFIVDDTWLGTVRSRMDAEAFQTDLSTENTMNEINHWIEDKTNGLIDKMLGEPLDEQARLALFNTVYFKGKWEIPFEANDTCKEDFYLYKGQDAAEQVDMMNLYETNLDYIANDFAEGVILPYQKNDDSSCENLAFVALKPIGNENIREVYDKLTDEVIMDILVNKQTELVNLKLPKFEITFDKELNECLSNMGLVECFDVERANFDRMGKTQSGDNLYISLVHQKAKIIVDEEGTEAAAVTEVIMACGAAIVEPQNPKEVYFNEPFVYMIMDLDKELPLFIGILDNPVS
ncbi:MAG: serpin family protein [Lachnospiraceae bacterium]|nr:serpin family protein [Lachnospiraceae bacterium]MDE7204895.1 serpin family protein [Lachnospiraceae bacterium]